MIKYDNRELLRAWNLFNNAGVTTDVFEFDLVNVVRQVLGNYFKSVRDQFTDAYEKKDIPRLKDKAKEMIGLLYDMDTILASNKNSLVGDWIAGAMALGTSTAEKKYYEKDARKIVTVWGQKGRHLVDYANRSWGGLMRTYYGERWKLFTQEVIEDVSNHKPFDEPGFSARIKDFEENWAEGSNQFPVSPKGSSLAISRLLYKKYAGRIGEGSP